MIAVLALGTLQVVSLRTTMLTQQPVAHKEALAISSKNYRKDDPKFITIMHGEERILIERTLVETETGKALQRLFPLMQASQGGSILDPSKMYEGARDDLARIVGSSPFAECRDWAKQRGFVMVVQPVLEVTLENNGKTAVAEIPLGKDKGDPRDSVYDAYANQLPKEDSVDPKVLVTPSDSYSIVASLTGPPGTTDLAAERMSFAFAELKRLQDEASTQRMTSMQRLIAELLKSQGASWDGKSNVDVSSLPAELKNRMRFLGSTGNPMTMAARFEGGKVTNVRQQLFFLIPSTDKNGNSGHMFGLSTIHP